jgi:hypothetical protein
MRQWLFDLHAFDKLVMQAAENWGHVSTRNIHIISCFLFLLRRDPDDAASALRYRLDAAHAYDKGAVRYHGEFARLNLA